MAVPTKRPCGVVSSNGTSTAVHGELSPHKDLAISTKPGGGFHCYVLGFPSSVFTLWLKTVNDLTAGMVVVGFAHPILWVTGKEPQGQALLLPLWLSSWETAGSAGLEVLDEVIFTQCDGSSLWRTSPSMNVISSSMDSLNSCMHSANWHGWPGGGGWAFSTQNCNALAYSRVFWGCFI